MKTILLSFEPEWFHFLESGKKKFEYRKHFPTEQTTAFFYVSAPEKKISGIAVFGEREKLSDWPSKYSNRTPEVQARIAEFMTDCRWAMPVLSFQKTSSISLEQLRRDLPGFIVPRMYYYIDDTDLFKYLKSKLEPIGPLLENSFSRLSDDDIC